MILAETAATGALVTAAASIVIALVSSAAAIFGHFRSGRSSDRQAAVAERATAAEERASAVEVAQNALKDAIRMQRDDIIGLRARVEQLEADLIRCRSERAQQARDLAELRRSQ